MDIEEIMNGEIEIGIERTADFFDAAQQLSKFIHGLPLEQPTNDRLVALMVEQVQQAEKGAFFQGFRMGMGLAEWEQVKQTGKPSLLNRQKASPPILARNPKTEIQCVSICSDTKT